MVDSNEVERILTIIGMFVLLPLTLGGNLIIILITYKTIKFHTANGILIANLALSDFLIATLAVPLRISQLFGSDWSHETLQCRITISFTLFFCTASVMNLTLISIDRFRSIATPFKYVKDDVFWNTIISIGLSWFISALLAFLPLFIWGGVENFELSQQDICRYLVVLRIDFTLIVFIFTVFLPFLLMIVIYTYIFIIAKRHLRKIISLEVHRNIGNMAIGLSDSSISGIGEVTGKRGGKRGFIRELRAAKMTAAVLGFFILFVLPIVIVDITEIGCGGFCVPTWFVKLAVCLSYMNPAVNIFIYAAASLDYRKACTQLIFGGFPCMDRRNAFSSRGFGSRFNIDR